MGPRGTSRLRVIEGARSARASGSAATSPEPPAARARAPREGGPDEAPRSARSRDLAHLDDAQLVTLGARGETQALEALYRRHAAFAIHLAARIEGSSRDVEDVAHDAFLKAFQHLGDLADPRSFRSWLGSIVVHAVRSRMRRTRLMNLLGLTNLFGRAADPIDLDTIASGDASPLVRAQLAQIYALLRTLPTDERIAWTLRCIEGHDLETVAKLARCSLATAKRRIAKAQNKLDALFVPPDASASSTTPPPEKPAPDRGATDATE
jgi:RNA polymerase sigma-70 factor (ECF subfamily)